MSAAVCLERPSSDPSYYVGTHIEFVPTGVKVGQKTMRWDVMAKAGDHLGEVKWFGRWRKYCFFPLSGCAFEGTCMREIVKFIEDRTRDQRTGI